MASAIEGGGDLIIVGKTVHEATRLLEALRGQGSGTIKVPGDIILSTAGVLPERAKKKAARAAKKKVI